MSLFWGFLGEFFEEVVLRFVVGGGGHGARLGHDAVVEDVEDWLREKMFHFFKIEN